MKQGKETLRMSVFRKFQFLSITFILFTFLSFSRYSIQVLTISGQETNKNDIKFTLFHFISSEFLLPSLERIQSIHILPVLKCYSDDHNEGVRKFPNPLVCLKFTGNPCSIR